MKSMHPTKFLGCNSRTLPFPIPAGDPGLAGLQSARSRAGPAGQGSWFCPLDLQRTVGCFGKPCRLGDFSAEGWSGKGLDPKGEAFLRPPGGGAPRMCQQRAEYVVPCSTQSQCPDLWSAPVRCAHWMPILGDPGAHEMGVPSRNGDPESTSGKPSPTPARSRPPPRPDPTPLPAPPGFAPPLPRFRRVPSSSGDPREHNWDRPATHSHRNLDPRSPGLARPGCAPGAFPAAVATSESTSGKPSPTRARSRPPPRAARVRPAPAALPLPSQPQWGPPRAQLGPPPTPATTRFPTRAARVRPAPGALPTFIGGSRGAPPPCPHARFQQRLSDLATAARSNTRTIHPPHRDNPSCL